MKKRTRVVVEGRQHVFVHLVLFLFLVPPRFISLPVPRERSEIRDAAACAEQIFPLGTKYVCLMLALFGQFLKVAREPRVGSRRYIDGHAM